jgi:hypothetical protein
VTPARMLLRRLWLRAVLLTFGQWTCLVSRELVNESSPGVRRHGGGLPVPPLIPGGRDDVDESSAHNLLQTWDSKDMDPGDSASVVKEREVSSLYLPPLAHAQCLSATVLSATR